MVVFTRAAVLTVVIASAAASAAASASASAYQWKTPEKKSENTTVPTKVHASWNSWSGVGPAASAAKSGCSAISETTHEPATSPTIMGVVSRVSPSTASTGLPAPPFFFGAATGGGASDVASMSTADDLREPARACACARDAHCARGRRRNERAEAPLIATGMELVARSPAEIGRSDTEDGVAWRAKPVAGVAAPRRTAAAAAAVATRQERADVMASTEMATVGLVSAHA